MKVQDNIDRLLDWMEEKRSKHESADRHDPGFGSGTDAAEPDLPLTQTLIDIQRRAIKASLGHSDDPTSEFFASLD